MVLFAAPYQIQSLVTDLDQVNSPKSDGELATTAPKHIDLRLVLRYALFHHLELVEELVQQHVLACRPERLGPAAVCAERGMAHAGDNRLPVAARADERSQRGVGLEAQEPTREHE